MITPSRKSNSSFVSFTRHTYFMRRDFYWAINGIFIARLFDIIFKRMTFIANCFILCNAVPLFANCQTVCDTVIYAL